MVDLFGDDGEPLEKIVTFPDKQEEVKLEVKVKTDMQEKDLPPSIPDDPFDIHQKSEQKQKRPAWIDEDDHNIR